MSSVVSRILEGNFIKMTGKLEFSSEKIEIEVSADYDYEGSFRITAPKGMLTEGYVLSSDRRMECLCSKISGSETEIPFHFHADLCEEGDVIKGRFDIISNLGEYAVPFTVTIVPAYLDSSVGPIRNLYHFTNLARNNWDEAVALFYSEDFAGILKDCDSSVADMYRALSNVKGSSTNVEEFLISTSKKQAAEYISGRKEIIINMTPAESVATVIERETEIVKNGWGYTNLSVICEGDFLFTDKAEISAADFTDNICNLKIFADPRLCRKGIHTGKIIIFNAFDRLEIPVEVRSNVPDPARSAVHSKKMLTGQITAGFIEYMLGLTPQKQYITEAERLIEQFSLTGGEEIFAKIFRARLCLIENRNGEADRLIRQANDILERKLGKHEITEAEILAPYCYLLYMEAMLRNNAEFAKKAGERILEIYRKDSADWRIGILLPQLPVSISQNATTKWNFLEEMYRQGCNSPVLFMYGVKLMNRFPILAKKADGFALRVIYFGIRNNSFDGNCIDHIIQLSQKQRDYNKLLLLSLVALYQLSKSPVVLQEVCSQLIKGRRTDSASFKWYCRGIEADLRLTGLYEYYMLAFDTESNIDVPKAVLMYFLYQNNLDYGKMAYIYYCLIRSKEDCPEVYENNLPAMQSFASEQIKKGRINNYLAAVYTEVLNPQIIDRQVAEGLANMLFAYSVTCENHDIVKACVYQKGCSAPFEYSLTEGKGYLSIYGNGNVVVFEDIAGNRFIKTAKNKMERLLNPGNYLTTVAGFVWNNSRLNLYLLGSGENAVTVTAENVDRFLHLSEDMAVSAGVRTEILIRILEYYSIADDAAKMSRCLERLADGKLESAQRARVFPGFLKTEHFSEALSWIWHYGPYFAECSDIERLLNELLKPGADRTNLRSDEGVLCAAAYVFEKELAGSNTVSYLSESFVGTIQTLRKIRKACKKFGLPCEKVDKRILLQMLFCGTSILDRREIVKEYSDKYPDSDLTRAVMAESCYGYFADDGIGNPELLNFVLKEHKNGKAVPKIVKLSFLKFAAEKPEVLDDEKRDIVLEYLEEMLEEHIDLGFFKDFLGEGVFPYGEQKKKLVHIAGLLEDRTVVEYKVSPGHTAVIHYMIITDENDNPGYLSEIMREACGGLCYKDFILFFGEKVKYYITEEAGESIKTTEEMTIKMSGINFHDMPTRYEIINKMLARNAVRKYSELDGMLSDYYKKEFLNKELFRLM